MADSYFVQFGSALQQGPTSDPMGSHCAPVASTCWRQVTQLAEQPPFGSQLPIVHRSFGPLQAAAHGPPAGQAQLRT